MTWRGVIALGLLGLALASVGCASTGPAQPPDTDALARQILVTLPLEDLEQARADVAAVARSYDVEVVDQWRLDSIGLHCAVYDLPPGRSLEAELRRLAIDPRISGAQSMRRFELQSASGSDPYAHLQPGMEAMQVPRSHRVATGRGIDVAVVDTAVDLAHPDLRDRIDRAKDFVGGAREGLQGDRHGTGVAGVIGASAGNGVGIIGVAPEARLWALEACWRPDDGGTGLCSSFTLAKALDYALDEGARVINLSLSGPHDPVLEALLVAAAERGVVVVAAARDDASSGGFPADLPSVIAARVADAATGGPPQALPAPGAEVMTTVPRGTYDRMSGSSMAAAHLAGAAAVLLSAAPGTSPAELRRALAGDSADDDVVRLCEAIRRLGVECP